MIDAPLDVVCQQLLAMACAGECAVEETFTLLRKAGPDGRADAGPISTPASTSWPAISPRRRGPSSPSPARRPAGRRRGSGSGTAGSASAGRRVIRWFWSNVGTITSEETVQVLADGVAIGTLEGAYAERLVPGDRFVLDGRCLEFRRREGSMIHARAGGGEPGLPIWHSDRQSLSTELAREVADFRAEGARRLARGGPLALRAWLIESQELESRASAVLAELIEAQERLSEVPRVTELLVEEYPVVRRAGIDLRVPRPAQPRGVRGAGQGDRGPAGPPVRPRPGPPGRRPGLVDPPARGGRVSTTGISPRS